MEKVLKVSKNSEKTPTKREVLRAVRSFYDPLGFLNPFTVRAKILLQSIWRHGTDWDELLHEDDAKEWSAWLADLPETRNCRIPRCLFEFDFQPVTVELDTFCDASEKAYATVVYSRAIYKDGSINTRIIASKSYVAPLKPLSIPRLELQAAVIGARLTDTVVKESKIAFMRRVYWSDSRTVLCWIRSEPRTYLPFVLNRLGEIDLLTNAKDWQWISTNENPADDATKVKKLDLGPGGIWLNGPKFLRQEEIYWPLQPPISKEEFKRLASLESKKVVMAIHKRYPSLPNPNEFDSWSRLIKVTAIVLVAKRRFRKIKITKVNVDDLQSAETLWVKEVQAETFHGEINALTNKKTIPNNSRLTSFTPYICQNGLLRARGRTSQVQNAEFDSNPVILDGKHPVVRLLITHYHIQFNHANNETVLNELKQKYCIVRVRVALKSIVTHCPLCQLRRARPSIPQMADLPVARLAHSTNPFSHCGLDYFGPMTVTIGRRREKRWGVLFTCLTMRAVHLEIADSLSADSAIMAIQRMTARRGQPSVFYSDNGTNIRGACEELKQAIAATDKEKLEAYGTKVGSKWSFIPPAAPHMGGAWESLVKSVKRALNAT